MTNLHWALAVALVAVAAPPAIGQRLVEPVSLNPSGSVLAGPQVTRSTADCAGVVAPPDGTPPDSAFRPPVTKLMVIPNRSAMLRLDAGTMFVVRFLVNRSGMPDSIQIRGVVDRRVVSDLRPELMKYQFHPAIYRGCLVPAWTEMSMTPGAVAHPPLLELVSLDWPTILGPSWTEPSGVLPPERHPAPVLRDPTLPLSIPSCAAHRPALRYGELPNPGAGHANGRVVLRFVIDSAGVPVDSTVRVIQTTGPKFTAEIHRVFPSLHYQSAWCSSGPVSMDVQATFLFAR